MKLLKVPHGTARALRRKDAGKFREAQVARAALLRCSTISYNLAPRRPGTRPLPAPRVFGLVTENGFTRIREYAVDSGNPYNAPSTCRPFVCSHGTMEQRKALDWLRERT